MGSVEELPFNMLLNSKSRVFSSLTYMVLSLQAKIALYIFGIHTIHGNKEVERSHINQHQVPKCEG